MGAAAEYLLKREWSMGNGQCPDCCGSPPKWHGHPLFPTANLIGHRLDCPLAASLRDLGETPLMLGGYHSDVVYESYINDGGFLATRPKTEHGCPKLRKMQQDFEDAVFDSLIGKVFEGIEQANPATQR